MAQRRNKRDALLLTAARLFKQQGFASASLDLMAGQLGITKPTLYYYVRSKSELIQACALAGFQQAMDGMRAALAGEVDVQAALKAYLQVLSTDFGWCMVRVDECHLPAASAQHMQQQRSLLEQSLGSAIGCTTQARTWLRALEGVALSLPMEHGNSLVALLCTQPVRAPHSVAAATGAATETHGDSRTQLRQAAPALAEGVPAAQLFTLLAEDERVDAGEGLAAPCAPGAAGEPVVADLLPGTASHAQPVPRMKQATRQRRARTVTAPAQICLF